MQVLQKVEEQMIIVDPTNVGIFGQVTKGVYVWAAAQSPNATMIGFDAVSPTLLSKSP